MTDLNPFASPRSSRRPAPVSGTARPSNAVKAIVAGLAVDLGGSFLTGSVLSVVHLVLLVRAGHSASTAGQILSNAPWHSPFRLLGTVLGCGLSVLGGFVCARLARRLEFRLVGIQCGIGMGLGFAMAPNQHCAVYWIGMIALNIACSMLGAWLGRRRNLSEAALQSLPEEPAD